MTICGPFMVIHVDNISQSDTTRLNRYCFDHESLESLEFIHRFRLYVACRMEHQR